MMTRERFEQTAHNCSYEEYMLCDCTTCDKDCIHKGAYRRLPESDGGLGLCPRLKEVTA